MSVAFMSSEWEERLFLGRQRASTASPGLTSTRNPRNPAIALLASRVRSLSVVCSTPRLSARCATLRGVAQWLAEMMGWDGVIISVCSQSQDEFLLLLQRTVQLHPCLV